MCCKRLAENAGRKKSPSGHHRRTLSDHIFGNQDTYRQSEKNLLSSNIFSICLHNMVNFGLPAAEIGLLVWGTPGNFNRFRVLAALLHGTLVMGVGQTLQRWTEGTTYIRQGGHHVGHWPTFLVIPALLLSFQQQTANISCTPFASSTDWLTARRSSVLSFSISISIWCMLFYLH